MVAMIAGGQWIRSGAVAAPAEGLTPFGFFMARGYGEPAVHPAMRFIAFKPSDGAKFRESFEKKHGPKGRDLIDSLGKGSYKTAAAGQNGEVVVSAFVGEGGDTLTSCLRFSFVLVKECTSATRNERWTRSENSPLPPSQNEFKSRKK